MRYSIANIRADMKNTKINLAEQKKNNKAILGTWKTQVIKHLDKTTKSTENRNRHWGESGQ